MNKTKKILSLLLVLSVFNAEAKEEKSNKKFYVLGAVSAVTGSVILGIQKFLVKEDKGSLEQLSKALDLLKKADDAEKSTAQDAVKTAQEDCAKKMGKFYKLGNFNFKSFKTIFAFLLVLVGLVLVFYGYKTSKEETSNN